MEEWISLLSLQSVLKCTRRKLKYYLRRMQDF